MNVAILGFGTVGSGVYEIIENRKSSFLENIHVTRILDLPQNKDKLKIITSDIDDIVKDKNIDVVVETLGGVHPAFEFIMQCLKNGKHVVTANKAVVAAHLNDFLEVAKQQNVHFLFEASTGGGIPWLASIQKTRRIDAIQSFYGIFNGTSNFILDYMYRENKDFHEALKLAQDLGYAEADPSADINGYDVQNKVVISSALSFDTYINMKDFPCYSMANITIDDIHYLKEKGKSIKYIGEAQVINNEYEAFVMPNIFDNSSLEANVNTNFNICTLNGETIGDLKFYGQGAGKLPTANAIIQDILDIASKKIEYKVNVDKTITYCDSVLSNSYLLRSEFELDETQILSKEWYNEKCYMLTKPLFTRELITLAKQLQAKDSRALIAKVANFN